MASKPMALVGKKHSALHSPAESVGDIFKSEDVQRGLEILELGGRMFETLARSRLGVALAAPQVGAGISLVVTLNGDLWVDPEIVYESSEKETEVEGCLSLPGKWFAVDRPKKVTLKYLSVTNGKIEEVHEALEGFDARVACHEVDHMRGLILDGRFEQVRHP